MGRPRLVDVSDDLHSPQDRGDAHSLWLVVADAPPVRYGEDAINRGLSDLDWVSRAAVAHEGVIESFAAAAAVLPMKLFTIFSSDDRAREHMRADARRIAATVRRVANHQEWGVRVMLDPAGATAKARAGSATAKKSQTSGAAFLQRKKAERDASAELARRAQDTVATLYDQLAGFAGQARRRAASELPVQGGPLLLDAAFLVPVKKSARFRAAVDREARTLGRHGYRVTLTGPWPPYTFVGGGEGDART
jgi:Gas vesicle synthesis protein GvpL/GvpF